MNVFITVIFALYIIPMSALAHTHIKADNYQPEKGKKILTVAIEEIGYFPFNYNENGEIKGFSVDVLHYFEAHSRYDFEFIIVPWPRALYLVSHGKVDLILTLFKTPEREKTYHFIEPSYGYEANQLFTLIENDLEFNGQLHRLTPYSIGTVREYSYGEYFDQAHYLNKLPALTEEVLLKLLLGKRTDAIISNPLIFKKILSKENMSSKVKAIEPYVSITPVHMALTKKNKDSQEIKKKLGQLTLQLKTSPYYQELLDKYQLDYKQSASE